MVPRHWLEQLVHSICEFVQRFSAYITLFFKQPPIETQISKKDILIFISLMLSAKDIGADYCGGQYTGREPGGQVSPRARVVT